MARCWESAPPAHYRPALRHPCLPLGLPCEENHHFCHHPCHLATFLLHAWKIHLKNPGTWPDTERMPEWANEALSHWKFVKDPKAEVCGQASFTCLPLPASPRACVDSPTISAAFTQYDINRKITMQVLLKISLKLLGFFPPIYVTHTAPDSRNY